MRARGKPELLPVQRAAYATLMLPLFLPLEVWRDKIVYAERYK